MTSSDASGAATGKQTQDAAAWPDHDTVDRPRFDQACKIASRGGRIEELVVLRLGVKKQHIELNLPRSMARIFMPNYRGFGVPEAPRESTGTAWSAA